MLAQPTSSTSPARIVISADEGEDRQRASSSCRGNRRCRRRGRPRSRANRAPTSGCSARDLPVDDLHGRLRLCRAHAGFSLATISYVVSGRDPRAPRWTAPGRSEARTRSANPGGCAPRKPRGMTPITSNGRPPSRIVRPTIDGSLAETGSPRAFAEHDDIGSVYRTGNTCGRSSAGTPSIVR